MADEKILQLALEQLTELPGWNVRLPDDPDNIAHVAELAESIFHVGVLEPLTAYANENRAYVVTNGHCRLEAVRMAVARGAPIKTVPVRLEAKRATEVDHTFSMIVRNSGKALSQLELGVACKRMVGFGWTEQDLADRSGYSVQHVRNVLTLASAPAEVRKLVETGQVSATLATQAVQAEGESATETLQSAVAEAEKEAEAKPAKKGKKAAPGKPQPVKATMKHVSKVKGLAKGAKLQAKSVSVQAAPDVDSALAELAEAKLLVALATFDSWALKWPKLRASAFAELLRPANAAPQSTAAADLAKLKLALSRVSADAPDKDGVIVLVMNAIDWEIARSVLKLDDAHAEFVKEHAVA